MCRHGAQGHLRKNLQLMPPGIASVPVETLRRGEDLIGGVPQIRKIDAIDASTPLLCNWLEGVLDALLVKEHLLRSLHKEILIPIFNLGGLEIPEVGDQVISLPATPREEMVPKKNPGIIFGEKTSSVLSFAGL